MRRTDGALPMAMLADPLLKENTEQRAPSGGEELHYRPDIDGLRAVAVVAVVVFHLTGRLTGGYVGVDVFFVISGFLITSILVRSLRKGTFSITSFYLRRVRRILPALLVLQAVALLVAYFYLLPIELVAFSKSLVASLLSVSNVFFWLGSGYFDDPFTKPLLHTWSLGVEEQFYLLFPLLLWGMFRFAPKRVAQAVITVAALSLLVSVALIRNHPELTFFLPVTRAWELLAGALIALLEVRFLRRIAVRNALSLAGLAAILYAVMRFDRFTGVPGWPALIPVLGASALIAAGKHGQHVAGRLLAQPPIVFVGRVSYSLYLWHWPLFVMQEHGLPVAGSGSPGSVKAILLVEAFLLAVLSWWLIETPVRTGKVLHRTPVLLTTVGLSVTVLLTASVLIIEHHGYPGRYSPQAQHIAAYLTGAGHDAHPTYREGTCFLVRPAVGPSPLPAECLAHRAGNTEFLLLGDSLAAQLYYGLAATFPQTDVLQATAAGCKPFLTPELGARPSCIALMRFMFEEYLPQHPEIPVLLAARWEPADIPQLAKTVSRLQALGIRVTLVGPIIEYDAPLPQLLAMAMRDHQLARLPRHIFQSKRTLDATLQRLAQAQWHISYISYFKDFCTPECITLVDPDTPLQEDPAHLTPPGSILVAQHWRASGEIQP